ncbi:MAG: hypothetical protein AB7U20_25255 [Planctomycetaceae bacterium]
MKRFSQVRTWLLLAAVAALFASTVWAAKPAPPPPPPPTSGPEVYEWRPDLGGWLDTSRNLVWGYEFRQLTGGTGPYDFLQSRNYPALMLGTADYYYDEAAYYYGIGDLELGDLFFDAAIACEDAASFTNWRFPTKDEASDAIAKKLFKYDIAGWSGYWSTPLGPGLAYDGWALCWTSTAGKKARGGFSTHWVYTPATGDLGEWPNGGDGDVIWVRTHVP